MKKQILFSGLLVGMLFGGDIFGLSCAVSYPNTYEIHIIDDVNWVWDRATAQITCTPATDCSTEHEMVTRRVEINASNFTNIFSVYDRNYDTNGESATCDLGIQLDTAAPVITELSTTANPNANGWHNNNGITYTISESSDANDISSVNITMTPSEGFTIETDNNSASVSFTGDQNQEYSYTGTATDNAGRTATITRNITVKIDTTPPVFSGVSCSIGSGTYTGQWTNQDVTCDYSITDEMSGVENSNITITREDDSSQSLDWPQNGVFTNSGVYTLSGSATDNAGNTSETFTTTFVINIDKTPPVISSVTCNVCSSWSSEDDLTYREKCAGSDNYNLETSPWTNKIVMCFYTITDTYGSGFSNTSFVPTGNFGDISWNISETTE